MITGLNSVTFSKQEVIYLSNLLHSKLSDLRSRYRRYDYKRLTGEATEKDIERLNEAKENLAFCTELCKLGLKFKNGTL